MNKKQYCVPAVTVAEGKLQPMLVSTSQLKSIQQQSLGTAEETTRTYLNIKGYQAWSNYANEEDEDFNF